MSATASSDICGKAWIEPGSFCGHLGPAKGAIGCAGGIRRRQGQSVRADLLFIQAAEGQATGASANRMGADFDRSLHQAPARINEFSGYGPAFKYQLRMCL